MEKINSKILYKNSDNIFYFCNCCNVFFLRYGQIYLKITPNKFHEFNQFINCIIDAYSDGLKPSLKKFNYQEDINALLSLSEIQLNEISDIFDICFIEIKRIILEINFQTNVYRN